MDFVLVYTRRRLAVVVSKLVHVCGITVPKWDASSNWEMCQPGRRAGSLPQ